MAWRDAAEGQARAGFRGAAGEATQEIQVTVPRRYVINVRTGGGSIDLRDTEGAASLSTSGGDISAKNVTGKVKLRTSGGSILADAIKGDVDADTSGGDVRLLRIDGNIRGNTSGGSVRCSLVGANRGISATTSGGDIELVLPRGIDRQHRCGDEWRQREVRAASHGHTIWRHSPRRIYKRRWPDDLCAHLGRQRLAARGELNRVGAFAHIRRCNMRAIDNSEVEP